MSLSSMLDETHGPLRSWWNSEFPSISTFTKAGLWKQPLASPPPATATSGHLAGVVGTAVDYRIRWLWSHQPQTRLYGVANGPSNLLDIDPGGFANDVDQVAAALAGPRSIDSSADDDALNRLSLVLAHFESAGRSRRPLHAMAAFDAGDPLSTMMAAQDDDLVKDVACVVHNARPILDSLLHGTPTMNPVFARSGLVGGADADLIVDDCLIDLKSTTRFSLDTNELRQVVTYALLDDIDEYGLKRIALFYLRRPQLLTWDLDELLKAAGSNRSRAQLSGSLRDTLLGCPV